MNDGEFVDYATLDMWRAKDKEKDAKILELENRLVEIYNILEVPTQETALEEVRQLQRAASELICLHNGGVDNWEWYSESLNKGGFFDDGIYG